MVNNLYFANGFEFSTSGFISYKVQTESFKCSEKRNSEKYSYGIRNYYFISFSLRKGKFHFV